MSLADTQRPNPGALAFYVDMQPPASDFRADVLEGLRKPQKALSPKYFYDEEGSRIFDRITEAPEYYVTDVELELLDQAHCPYSQFPVAVIIQDSSGTLFEGVNVESAAFPSGLCAEKVALGAGVSAMGGAFDPERGLIATRTGRPTPPCGSCRQLLVELAPHAEVVAWGVEGEVGRWSVRELLPNAFELS